MGMDVYGSNPNSKAGEYFHSNVWNWSALWAYCASVSPQAASLGKAAYVNDGRGLDAEDAEKLAAALREQLTCGATKNAVKAIEEFEVAPPVPPAIEALVTIFNASHAAVVLPRSQFSEQDVHEFAEFLEHSGGFEIW